LPIFIGLNVIGLGITEACIAFTVYVLDLTGPVAYNISGNLIGTGLATVFRFAAYKKYVFKHPAPEGADALGLEVENVLQV
jgi:putative flippase GtrA